MFEVGVELTCWKCYLCPHVQDSCKVCRSGNSLGTVQLGSKIPREIISTFLEFHGTIHSADIYFVI